MSGRDPHLVFVGMPTRDGSMSEQTRALWERLEEPVGPWKFVLWKVKGGSIGHARNLLTSLALESNAGAMIQLDADNVAGPEHVERLLSHAEPIVGALYPRKELRWPTRWNARLIGTKRADGLHEAAEIGAGFLRVDLDVVELILLWLKAGAHERAEPYRCEDEGLEGRMIFDLWREEVVEDVWTAGEPAFRRKLSEDFSFCRLAKACGFKVWADTRCQVGHVGGVDYLDVARFLMLQEATRRRV